MEQQQRDPAFAPIADLHEPNILALSASDKRARSRILAVHSVFKSSNKLQPIVMTPPPHRDPPISSCQATRRKLPRGPERMRCRSLAGGQQQSRLTRARSQRRGVAFAAKYSGSLSQIRPVVQGQSGTASPGPAHGGVGAHG